MEKCVYNIGMKKKVEVRGVLDSRLGKLVFWVGLSLGVGFLGSIFTTPSISDGWYAGLVKPFFAPPNWVFGPVWTLLFVFMGIAVYLVSVSRGVGVRVALWLFVIHLLFNFLWSFLFFFMKRPDLAYVEILVLWYLIWVLRKKFVRINRLSGCLLVPYLVWVGFASFLNLAIVILN